MKESRLFKILYYLINHNPSSAVDLAKKFEVSVRTIYRDIDALSQANIPIYTKPGRNGGIYLMDDFILNKAILSNEEKREIITALQTLSTTENIKNTAYTLNKLSAVFNVDIKNWLEIDFSRWGNKENDNEKFESIKNAIINNHQTEITYANSYEDITKRIIYPIKLSYKSMSWYLKAYCTKKEDFRIFKLNRILNLKVLDKTFSPTPFKEEETPLKENIKYEEIILRFPKEISYRVYDEFDITNIKKEENGDLTVYAHMPSDYWLINFLLSFSTQVEIIKPKYLKEILAKKAKEIYEKNKTWHMLSAFNC